MADLAKSALLISDSRLESDPRVRRQIDWLVGAGWTVDTVGLGPHPTADVRTHYELLLQHRWLRSKPGAVLLYGLFPASLQFRLATADRIPREVGELIRRGEYSAVVFNEYEFAPWVRNRRIFGGRRTRLHLDMHEHRDQRRGTTPWQRLTHRYYRWTRRAIANPAFDSRSTVARGIAELYENEFGFEPMSIVRNIPPYFDQRPSPVDPNRVGMLFHGMASWERGFDQILEAMSELDERFTMTFMLTPNRDVIERLRDRIPAELAHRIRIVPPAPMREIATAINPYDLEIVFYPPTSTNVRLALPNKVFEAVQGRLGLITGESPMISEIVRHHGNGIVVEGWTGHDLAVALNGLTTDDIARLKAAADAAAKELNAEAEGRVFLSNLSPASA